jgi:Ser/Thr protein kinase RdoA (MazF antagonist)
MSDLQAPSGRARPGDLLLAIASRFPACAAGPVHISALGDGLINHSYRVESTAGAFVLQRINGSVFPAPARIMDNLAALQAAAAAHPELGVRLPALAAADDGLPYARDDDGECWRLMECIEPSRTLKRLDTASQATEVGRVLGSFHRLGATLGPDALAVTLPGFHHTPGYLAALDGKLANAQLDAETAAAVAFIEAHRALAGLLEDAQAKGLTHQRVIHGDPKLDNLLFDTDGERAICLIDLDTVQPGLVHHDMGDCLRSCCNRGGEAGSSSVRFDLELCEALLGGYAEAAGDLLSAPELELVAAAIRLIPLELAIRFLTDHLRGDRYFRVRHHGENLLKARRQLALVADIERQQAAIDAAVRAAFTRAH